MTLLNTFGVTGSSVKGEDARETLESLLLAGMRIATVAAFATISPPDAVANVIVESYATPGDAPPCRYRRTTNATEATLSSARADALGKKWIIDEDTLLPEWFGAKGNGNGYSASNPNVLLAGASGADDAPAFRATEIYSKATGKPCETMAGKIYRFGSHVTHRGFATGQKTVLTPGTGVRWRFKSDMIHDSYDPVSGSVQFLFTDGVKGDLAKRVGIIFDGGRLIHPDDAVKPRVGAAKGSITFYFAEDFECLRVSRTGQSPTNFQVSVFNSSVGYIDGGRVGFPIAPFNDIGDDGVHVIVSGNGNACRDIRIRNMRVRSGDDPISITAELNAVNCVVERIFVDTLSCETDEANIIKIHIVNNSASNPPQNELDDSRGNIIQRIYINNICGDVSGNYTGAGVTINNDRRDKDNVIRRVYINGVDADVGPLPKTRPTISLQGQSIRVYGADEVHFTRMTITGQQNAALMFSDCNDCTFDGELINDLTNTNNVLLVGGLAVSKAMNQGASRRIYFSGTPDLSAVAAEVAAWAGDLVPQVNDTKLPIVTISGMAVAGHNASFVIKAVDNVNKTIDVDNYRSGTSEEPAATGTASIYSGTMPSIMLLDCQNVKVHARTKNPLSWATAYVAGRARLSLYNEVILDIEGQKFGHAIYCVRSRFGRYGFTGRNGCQSGSTGMYAAPGGAGLALTPYNHFLASDDFDGLADPLMGWGRTVMSEFATDRFDHIRGRTPTRISGTIVQKAGTTSIGTVIAAGPPAVYSGINANASVYGGHIPNNIDERHLRSLTAKSTGHGGIDTVVWDKTNARFNVTTLTAPTADITWTYLIEQPA